MILERLALPVIVSILMPKGEMSMFTEEHDYSDEHAYMKAQIQDNLRLKETDELLEIWHTADHEEWTDMAFEVIQEILRDRLGEVPAQEVDEPESVEPESSPKPAEPAPAVPAGEIQKFLRQQTYETMDEMSTDELIDIWQTADHDEWNDLAFDVVHQILMERNGEVPVQEALEQEAEDDEPDEQEPEALDTDPAPEVLPDLKAARSVPEPFGSAFNLVGMRCPDCGKAISEQDQVCPHCGVDLDAPLDEAELQSLAAEHLEKAQNSYDLGRNFKSALADCDLALEYTPNSARAHNLRGLILDALGKTALAVRAYREAARLDPAFTDARDNLADAEAELKSRKA
jgi:tetratricopeptide (TPR) repeat protein